MDVEDFVTLSPIKTEGKEDPPPPLQHIQPMEYFRRTELVANFPPYLQHSLHQPYQSKGNHWATGDSSLMNSDLTVALHRLFLLMAGYPPSEDQQVRLRHEGCPEALLYNAMIHLIEGRVIQSQVAKLMPLDEHFYLKIVPLRISLTSAHRLFPVVDGIKTPGTMEFRFWQLIQNTVGGAPLPPPSQASLDSQHPEDDSMLSSDSGISSDSPLPSTRETGIPADIKDQMSQYASDDSSASSSIQAFDHDPTHQSPDQQPLDDNDHPAETVAADEQQAPTTTSSKQASTPSGVSSSATALHFPGYLPPNNFFNPTADEGEELSFPVDAPHCVMQGGGKLSS